MYVRIMLVHAADTLALEDRLAAVHENVHAELAALFDLIREFERREAYLIDGARNMPDWLCFRFGYAERTAREYCRVSRALGFLPAIDEMWRCGLLTLDKVRWLTEFCTPDEDADWARDAIGLDASWIKRYALHRRRRARELADAAHERRYMKVVADPEDGAFRFWGRLSAAEGAVVKAAIDRVADQQPRDAETDRFVPYEQRCADALVELASLRLGADPDPDRATVVCHVDAAVLSSADGVATLEGEMPVCAETVRRILCDGRLQAVVHGENGEPIGLGTVARVVTPALRRIVLERDRGCVWDGCSSDRWLHAHHVLHFADGGPTSVENLVMLCGTHHRLLHEDGWKMFGRPGHDLRIIRPDGTPLRPP